MHSSPRTRESIPHFPEFLLAVLVIHFAGCSIHAYVSDNYPAAASLVPLRAKMPIAREIKFIFADGSVVTGVGGGMNFLVATNLSTTEQLRSRGLTYIQQNYPDVEQDDFVNTSKLTNRIALQDSNMAGPGRAALDKSIAGESLSAQEAGAASTVELSRSLDQTVGRMNATLGDHHSTGPVPYVQGVPMIGRLLAEWDSRPIGCLFLVPA
jgi:hypothetical protein